MEAGDTGVGTRWLCCPRPFGGRVDTRCGWPSGCSCPGIPPARGGMGMWGATWSTPSPQGRSQDPGAHRQSRGQGTAGVPAWLGLVHPTCELPESSDQAHPPCQTAVVLSVWGLAGYMDPHLSSASTPDGADITPSPCRDSSIAFSKGSIPWCKTKKDSGGMGRQCCRKLQSLFPCPCPRQRQGATGL